jgi:predicted DNA binding CopG/RHH family protein
MPKKGKFMKKKINLPEFKNEDQERNYWSKIDLSKHLEIRDFMDVSFPDLHPTSRAVSIRIPEYILVRLKEQANEQQVPYQTLMKQYIAKGVMKN